MGDNLSFRANKTTAKDVRTGVGYHSIMLVCVINPFIQLRTDPGGIMAAASFLVLVCDLFSPPSSTRKSYAVPYYHGRAFPQTTRKEKKKGEEEGREGRKV